VDVGFLLVALGILTEMNNYLSEVRWFMVAWVFAVSVVVWLLGAPAWVSVLVAVWMLYKENE